MKQIIQCDRGLILSLLQ